MNFLHILLKCHQQKLISSCQNAQYYFERPPTSQNIEYKVEGFLGVKRITGRRRRKGEDSVSSFGSGAGSSSGGEGLSDPWSSKELLIVTGRLYFSSKEELSVLLSRSFSLLFVLSSALRLASFRINPSIDWLARREIPRLPVVGVVRFLRPPVVHYSMETMSSKLGSTRVGSVNPVGVASFGRAASCCATFGRGASGCTTRVGVAFVAFGVGSEHRGCCVDAERSVRISCSNFSILVL